MPGNIFVTCDFTNDCAIRAGMPRTTPPKKPARSRTELGSFRQRYAELEQRRAELLARIANMSPTGRQHPGYKRAQTLLNEMFRKASIAQRGAVLQSAAWLIDLLKSRS
jgi:hypothetical protein